MKLKSDRKQKHFIIFFALLASCLSLLANPSLAFIRQEVLTRNIITMDPGIKIQLNEYSLNAANQKVPFQDLEGIMPGQTYPKIVQVENLGSQPAYIRIKLELEAKLRPGQESTLKDSDLVSLDFHDDWEKRGDYWYYKQALAGKQETPPLFTRVTFSPKLDQNYMGSQIRLRVKAYATQVKHNGSSVFNAQGWPAE